VVAQPAAASKATAAMMPWRLLLRHIACARWHST
jgi:hypothetical protein